MAQDQLYLRITSGFVCIRQKLTDRRGVHFS